VRNDKNRGKEPEKKHEHDRRSVSKRSSYDKNNNISFDILPVKLA